MKKMKNLLRYGIIALILFAGCTRENPIESEAEELTAIYSPETRTSYSNNKTGSNFSWDTGDEIAIMQSDQSTVTCTLTPYSDPIRAKVNYLGGTRGYFAFFPASCYSHTGMYYYTYPLYWITFPNSYDISGKSADWSPIPMCAINDPLSEKLLFKHLGGLARIECANVPSATTFLQVQANTYLSGNFEYIVGYNDSSGFPIADHDGENRGNYVTFTVSNNSNQVLNLPLPESWTYEYLKVKALDSSNQKLKEMFIDYPPIESTPAGNGYHLPVDMADPYIEIEFESSYPGRTINYSNASSTEANKAECLSNKGMKYLSSVNIGSAYGRYYTYGEDYIQITTSSTHLNLNLNSTYFVKLTKIEVDFSSSVANKGLDLAFSLQTAFPSNPAATLNVGSDVNTRVTRSVSFSPALSSIQRVQIKRPTYETQTLKIYAIRLYYETL